MKQPFSALTLKDVQYLRRKSTSTTTPVIFNFDRAAVIAAQNHLTTLYQGRINASFSARILLLNEIY